MKNNHNWPPQPSIPNLSRRRFVQGSSALVMGSSLPSMSVLALGGSTSGATGKVPRRLANSPLGFNGERQDPTTGLYHLGQGYRVYNPALMRFHAADSMSPFGQGGVNAYAYCLGNPINLRDPSGHFGILSLLIGIIIGAVIGAVTSAVSEGIRAGISQTPFDWKQVIFGAVVGGISGGFGGAAVGAKAAVKTGLSVADFFISGAVNNTLQISTGTNPKTAAISSLLGGLTGRISFGGSNMAGAMTGMTAAGMGVGVGAFMKPKSATNEHVETIPHVGVSGRGTEGLSLNRPISPSQPPKPGNLRDARYMEPDMRGTLESVYQSYTPTTYRSPVADQRTDIIPNIGHAEQLIASNMSPHVLLGQGNSPAQADKGVSILTDSYNQHFRFHKKLMEEPYSVLMVGAMGSNPR
jgi:RHS repeat-associated protein